MKIVEGFRLRNILGQATIVGEGIAQVDFNKLVTLNSSAVFLWQSVEGKEFEVSDLVDLLVNKYNITQELAETDAKEMLDSWIKIGLVKE